MLVGSAAGCSRAERASKAPSLTYAFTVDCPELNLEFTTTVDWQPECREGVVGFQAEPSLPRVSAQVLSTSSKDPLHTLLALLKSKPGIHDVELHLTDVFVCGSLTCLAYEATFLRLSNAIDRFGVLAVGNTTVLEFTASFEAAPDARLQDRPIAFHLLNDLTHGLYLPES